MEKIIEDYLLTKVYAFLPKRKTKVGRPAADIRLVLGGIFFVLTHGCKWSALEKTHYGNHKTIHKIYMKLVRAGFFKELLEKIVKEYLEKDEDIAKRFYFDTSYSKAQLALFGGKNPTDRAKNGVKKSILINEHQVIFSILTEAANKHDVNLLLPHVENLENFYDKEEEKMIITDAAWDSKSLAKKLLDDYNIILDASKNKRRSKKKVILKKASIKRFVGK